MSPFYVNLMQRSGKKIHFYFEVVETKFVFFLAKLLNGQSVYKNQNLLAVVSTKMQPKKIKLRIWYACKICVEKKQFFLKLFYFGGGGGFFWYQILLEKQYFKNIFKIRSRHSV
jgi:hypothetical protein